MSNSSRMRSLVACTLVVFSTCETAADIASIISRSESTLRPNEKLHPPRCTRNEAGEIISLNLDFVVLLPGDVEEIAKCSKLESLSLMSTSVSDEQLKSLVALKSLRALRLNDTSIGDTGLMHLTQIKSLKSLCLSRVEATPEGVRQLKLDLPALQVGYSQKKLPKN